MRRLGPTKEGQPCTLKTPIKVSGNIYYLKKICYVCCMPIRNAKATHSVVCRDTRSTESGNKGRQNKSNCQKKHDAFNNKNHRDRLKAQGIKRNSVDHSKLLKKKYTEPAKRICLSCDKEFKSNHKQNRICPKCRPGRHYFQKIDEACHKVNTNYKELEIVSAGFNSLVGDIYD